MVTTTDTPLLYNGTTWMDDFGMPQWSINLELTYVTIVLIIGIPGNILIIFLQLKNKMKTSTDYLVMALAMYELVASSIVAPLILIRNASYFDVYVAISSTFMCRFYAICYNFSLLGGAQMLAAISVDRYIKTCLPLNTSYSDKQAKIVCVVILALTSCLCIPHAAFSFWNDTFLMCNFYADLEQVSYVWGLVQSGVFITVFIIISIAYIKITISLRQRHAKKIRAQMQVSGIEPTSGGVSKIVARWNRLTRSNAVGTTDQSPQTEFESFKSVSHVKTSTKHKWTKFFSKKSGGCLEPSQSSSNASNVNRETSYHSDNPDFLGRAHCSGVHVSETDTRMFETEAGTDHVARNAGGQPEVGAPRARPSGKHRQLLMESRNLNKLTLTLLLISFIYFITWLINWILYLAGPFIFGIGLFYISFTFPIINCITNPILFISMSARFRNNVRKSISNCCKCK